MINLNMLTKCCFSLFSFPHMDDCAEHSWYARILSGMHKSCLFNSHYILSTSRNSLIIGDSFMVGVKMPVSVLIVTDPLGDLKQVTSFWASVAPSLKCGVE